VGGVGGGVEKTYQSEPDVGQLVRCGSGCIRELALCLRGGEQFLKGVCDKREMKKARAGLGI